MATVPKKKAAAKPAKQPMQTTIDGGEVPHATVGDGGVGTGSRSVATTIRVEDTYPRPNARPLDAELVKRLTESIRLIGFSPADPIVVRKDGNIYWIIDGGHRTAAAKELGLEEIPAVIEDLDDAGVLTYEGSLNLQRPDTEDERWARAQQFLLLGDSASEDQIAVATGLDVEAQRKAFKVIRKLNDATAAEDVTLDQALHAHEFIDDEEAFAAIMNAGVNWNTVASKLVKERDLRQAVEKCRAIIAASGCELLDADFPTGKTFLGRSNEKPDEAKYARITEYAWSGYAEISWHADATAETNPEEEARREAAAQRKAELDEARVRRLTFLHEQLAGDMDPALATFAEKAWEGDGEDGLEVGVCDIEEALSDLKGFTSRVYAAILSCAESEAAHLLENPDYRWCVERSGELTSAYFEALARAGYEAVEVETASLAIIAKALTPESEQDDGDE